MRPLSMLKTGTMRWQTYDSIAHGIPAVAARARIVFAHVQVSM